MALTSPGVEVTVIDQSQYLPAATSSVPLVVFATAQDKVNPNSNNASIAPGTTAANAGKLFEVTSQRDLVSIYGSPKFYTTADGTPIQGYELNEYGLFAAYSALNVSNRCYCLRADIDLASLVASTGRPTGEPDNGAWWLDTTSSAWGVFEWDAVKEIFVKQNVIVITDSANIFPGAGPLASIGNIGDYAVVAIPNYDAPDGNGNGTYWQKIEGNIWVELGSLVWLQYTPAIVGTNSNPTLNVGDTFIITLVGSSTAETSIATISVPGLGSNTALGVANQINALQWLGVNASVNSSGRLVINITQDIPNVGMQIAAGTGTVLNDLGIAPGTYYEPDVFYGTASQLPLWGAGQLYPRPSGSVWIKVGSAGEGLVPVVKQFDAVTGSWKAKTVTTFTNDAAAINTLDATGGQAIPAGTVYAQYNFNGQNVTAPIYLWERVATGPTVVTGTSTSPSFTNGPYTMEVYVTTPNSSAWSGPYTVSLADNTDATDFVIAWQSASIPYTTAVVTSEGSIQLTHTLGGAIRMNDINSTTGLSSDLLSDAGFDPNVTDGAKYGYYVETTFSGLTPTTSGAGVGCQLTVINTPLIYHIDAINAAGTGYAVGDSLTISGVNLGGVTGANDCLLKVTSVNGSGGVTHVTLDNNTQDPAHAFDVMLSNFVMFDYTANEGAPTEIPKTGTNWFYAVTNMVDIMVNTTAGWKGYRNVNFNSNGFPLPSGTNQTDPNGPIVSASAPTVQSDGTPLAYGDLWIDTSDAELYPIVNRWQQVDGEDMWVLIDTSDQTTGKGLLFADARWSTDQNTINPANDPMPSIKSLLTSNNLDLDAPNATNYPVGMLLFNTRRSGNNVKQWKNNYFTPTNFPDQTYPTITGTWVSASGLKINGQAYMGRQAQRNMVVQALRSVIDTNVGIRDEDNNFNLITCPAYPETQSNMNVLNKARGETGYILGDTPMRLKDDATEIQAWADSQAVEGGPSRDTYLGLFYPSGIATDLEGNDVVVPPSHMMLFTFLRNDQVAYPWFAAAGTRRGIISNANGIGYIDSKTGEFQPIKTRIGIRDVLYTKFINPLVFFTGNGLLNYGNKTSFNSQSALDRTNVARLVAYIRRQLTIAARPFVFEPNDALTRQQISGVVESLMVDLVAKRGIYDYLVVCDESNNTPARIDRNELWIDVAVEPVKAAEFIYIPVRILNTGELSGA